MKYYENTYGIFSVEVLPDGVKELTKEEYDLRLEEIREQAELNQQNEESTST